MRGNLILAEALGYTGNLASSTTPFSNSNIVKYEYLDGDAVHYQFIDGGHGVGRKDDILNIVDTFISDGI